VTTQPVTAPSTSGRRLGGWGFEGRSFPPSPGLLTWLEKHLGETQPFPLFDPIGLAVPKGRRLPDLPLESSSEPLDRLAHARGQGLTDLLRLRSGTVPAIPDGVARPSDSQEVAAMLEGCAAAGIRVIPWGGGTSVTGGVNVVPGKQSVITLDLERLSGLEGLDPKSGLATFGAGTSGPAIEGALRQHGLTLGHFPQSWELSTLGGWIATRASGQESLGYGGICDLVAGLDMVAPAGRLELPPLPASAAGPDLRQLVLGSEGRLGVVTSATVRVRPQPERLEVEAAILPSWEAGVEAARRLTQERVPLSLLRLSDETETAVAMTVGLSGHPWMAPLVRRWLDLRGIKGGGCLMLLGSAVSSSRIRTTFPRARALLRTLGAVSLGSKPGRQWLADRFRHPYLRDGLLDRGVATDTLETAAPWTVLPAVYRATRRALESTLAEYDESTAVLCHLSHPYPDGASLYFTFFFRCPADVDLAIERWGSLKRAATSAIVGAGGTLSHHHGVGSWHAPWLAEEIGSDGVRLLAAVADAFDPRGVLNPTVLLDSKDRLET
jgi:alkyldihydroxyacetonephosphate synthase